MICSSPLAAADLACGLLSPPGEIGMVDRSTGEVGCASPLAGFSAVDEDILNADEDA